MTARIIYAIYRHRKTDGRESNAGLGGSNEGLQVNASDFYRMFALGSLDSLLTLPLSTLVIVLNFVESRPSLDFYQGWTSIHSNWKPVLVPKSIWSMNKLTVGSLYWGEWINPFTAVIFFALFGMTQEARKRYQTIFRYLGRPFGVMQLEVTEDELPPVDFGSGRETGATNTSNTMTK